MRTITLNDDDMREPCEHNNMATCGHCNRSWCFTCNPTPSARCPFEYEHFENDPAPVLLNFDNVTEAGKAKLLQSLDAPIEDDDEDTDFPYRDVADDEVKRSSGPLAPHGGCNWMGCRECFPDEETRNRMEREEIERAIRFLTDYGFTVTKVDENND